MNHALRAMALGFALTLPSSLPASDLIPIGPRQMEALGIDLSHPIPASGTHGPLLGARVVIPPGQENVVATPMTGVLENIHVANAQAVTAGQQLARLLSPGLLDLQHAYLQALNRMRQHQDFLARDEALFRDGIIAERRLIETRAVASESRIALDTQRQLLELAGLSEADLRTLTKDGRMSSSLLLRAPHDGIVLEIMAMTGERLEAMTPVLRMATLQPLWLELRVPMGQIDNLAQGARVSTADGGAQGHILHIGAAVQPGDDSVPVYVELDSSSSQLRPGQFLQARILDSQAENSFQVPSAAVVRKGEQDFLFVKQDTGFAPIPVTRTSAWNGQLIVTGPLRLEDRLAVTGIAAIKAAWLGIGGGE